MSVNAEQVLHMAKLMGEEAFGEFLTESGMSSEQIEAIHKILRSGGDNNVCEGPPLMTLFHTSNPTTSIMAAAAGGDVTEEAVAYQLARGSKGVDLLISAAGRASSEWMSHNVQMIMDGILEAKVPFTERLASTLMSSSDLFRVRTAEGLSEFISTVVNAEPGMGPEDKAECISELYNDYVKDAVKDGSLELTAEQLSLFAPHIGAPPNETQT